MIKTISTLEEVAARLKRFPDVYRVQCDMEIKVWSFVEYIDDSYPEGGFIPSTQEIFNQIEALVREAGLVHLDSSIPDEGGECWTFGRLS